MQNSNQKMIVGMIVMTIISMSVSFYLFSSHPDDKSYFAQAAACTDPDGDGYGTDGTDLSECSASATIPDNCPTVYNPSQTNSDALDPTVVSDLEFWVDANQITGLSDGAAVASWNDLSGNAYHVTQGTASRRPTYETNELNGYPVVRFTASESDTLTTTQNFTAPTTVMYVGRLTGGTNGRMLNALSNNWLLGFWSGARQKGYFEGWVTSSSASPVADTNWYIYTATIPGSGTNTEFYENGTLIAANQGGIQGPNGLSLSGYAAASEFSDGEIAEIVIYNKALDGTERQQIEGYLAEKYNITISHSGGETDTYGDACDNCYQTVNQDQADSNLTCDSFSTPYSNVECGDACEVSTVPYFSSFPLLNGTTDFNAEGDLTNVSNMKIANSSGSITWDGATTDVENENFNSYVSIGTGYVSLDPNNVDDTLSNDSGLVSGFNARVSLPISSCENYTLYYYDAFSSSLNDIQTNGQVCNEVTTPACTNISCTLNRVSFDVPHFDSYGATGATDCVDSDGDGYGADGTDLTNCSGSTLFSDNCPTVYNPSQSDSEPSDGTNEALAANGGTATASAEYSAAFAAGEVIDGVITEPSQTGYWLLPDATTGWVQVDLGTISSISEIKWLNTHNSGYNDSATLDYRIALSTDGSDFSNVIEDDTMTFSASPSFQSHTSSLPQLARYVRFYADSCYSARCGLNELEVYINNIDGVGDACDMCWYTNDVSQVDTNGNCPSFPFASNPQCGDNCDTCGNGTTEGSEQCDDGNTNDGDGCNSYCKLDLLGYLYRQPITISSALVDENLTNFPIVLTDTAFSTDVYESAQADGSDLFFTSDLAGTNALSWEVVSWDSGTESSEVWVNVDSLSSSSDTTIYVWYGNPNVLSPSYVASPWSDYVAVWHLNDLVTDEQTSGTHVDSSPGGYDGTQNNNAYLASGKIGGAQDFDGSGDYINFGDVDYISDQEFNFSIWLNNDTFNQAFIFGDEQVGNKGVMLQTTSTGYIQTYNNGYFTSTYQLPIDDSWNMITYQQSASGLDLYVNGSFHSQITTNKHLNTNHPDYLGAFIGSGRYYNGQADELQITNQTRSAGWISTTYNNQNDPASFASAGTSTILTGQGLSTDLDVNNNSPLFTVTPSDDGTNNAPVNGDGDSVTFTATAKDPNIDQYYLAVCATSGITAANDAPPACDSLSETWGISAVTNSESEASVNYSPGSGGGTLAYDAQSGDFTLGETVTGGTSGATAIITADIDAGATGTLKLASVSGTFQDDELITDGSAGSATVNGTLADNQANETTYCTGAHASLKESCVWHAFVCDASSNSSCYPTGSSPHVGDRGFATGTISFSGVPADAEDIVIDGVIYEFDRTDGASCSGGVTEDVCLDISENTAEGDTADSLVAAEAGVNSHLTARGGNVYIYADAEGVSGNSIQMSFTDCDVCTLNGGTEGDGSTATLSGGNDADASPFKVNHAPVIGTFTAGDTSGGGGLNPATGDINADETVYLNLQITDIDVDGTQDTVDMYVCDTDSFTYGASPACGGTEICSVTGVDPTTDYAECSSATLVSSPVTAGVKTLYVFVQDGHGMGDQAGTHDQNYTVASSPPTLITYTTNEDLAPPAGGSHIVNFSVTIEDLDGDIDVTGVQGILFDSAVVSSSCTPDENNCYQDTNCVLDYGTSDTELTANCAMRVWFNANASTQWDVQVSVTDNSGTVDFANAGANLTNLALQAIDIVEDTLDYGSLIPGSDSVVLSTSIGNVGNTAIDIYVEGDDMCPDYPTCATVTIPVGQQKWHHTDSSFLWDDSGVAGAYALVDSSSGTGDATGCLNRDIAVRDDHTSLVETNESLYWSLRVPVSQSTGAYSGTNTIIVTPDSTCSTGQSY